MRGVLTFWALYKGAKRGLRVAESYAYSQSNIHEMHMLQILRLALTRGHLHSRIRLIPIHFMTPSRQRAQLLSRLPKQEVCFCDAAFNR